MNFRTMECDPLFRLSSVCSHHRLMRFLRNSFCCLCKSSSPSISRLHVVGNTALVTQSVLLPPPLHHVVHNCVVGFLLLMSQMKMSRIIPISKIISLQSMNGFCDISPPPTINRAALVRRCPAELLTSVKTIDVIVTSCSKHQGDSLEVPPLPWDSSE